MAAGVAQCDPMRTGFISLKLAKPLYVAPLLMAYTPILINGPWDQVILVWVTAALGFICTSAALEGYFLRILTVLDRFIMGAAGAALFWNGMWIKTTGFALMIVSIVLQLMRPKDFVTAAPLEAESTEG